MWFGKCFIVRRDARLRAFYKLRYDTRQNLIDWDFNMKLHEKVPITDISCDYVTYIVS